MRLSGPLIVLAGVSTCFFTYQPGKTLAFPQY
jgi:hypothetical protein